MKYLIIMPRYSLPVDGSCGGAVEQLVNSLIVENEKQQGVTFDIITPSFCNEKYKNTNVYSIKESKLLLAMKRILRKVFKGHKFVSEYYKKAYKIAEKIKPDRIVFECFYEANVGKFANLVGKENMFLHKHNCNINETGAQDCFGNIIAVSQFLRDGLQEFFKNTSLNIEVLKNCVSNNGFMQPVNETEKYNLRHTLGLKEDDFVIIYCGRLHPEKGIDKLLLAMKDVVSKHKNAKLLVIGESFFKNSKPNKYTKMLTQIADEIKDNIIFTGFVANKELPKYYQMANLQVIPSICEESAGIVAMEGAASKIDQIITNSGGLPEYAGRFAMVNKENGLVENLGAEISKSIEGKLALKESKNEIITKEEYYKKMIDILS